ncbi:hypothetical protein EXM98_04775 [Clostridium botulinum]|nr:hypothetical protein [Clostridium botulinum]NFC60550.1 hypothetical protein [Clostridium botulinum]NFC68558.1 hypothetical protein [Clostridium botulinum]NFE37165.1 hypothetical protein [Clostridium botulinum]NFE40358.1 hypothetical protein [Clostridium botulinum]
MKNFNWNEFKKGEIVVHCDTKEKAKDFLNKCVSNNIRWADTQHITPDINYFKNCGNGICYRFHNIVLGLVYETLKYFKDDDHVRIIKWKIGKGENGMDIDITPAAEKAENILNELTTNKIDYDREYNIMEIMEFEEGTEFTLGDRYICKVEDGYLKIKDGTGSWIIEHLAKGIINAKFKLVKKDKKVEFIEAIKAFTKGKTIKVQYKNIIEIYEPEEFNGEYILTDGDTLSPENILHGEWYIKED